MISAEYPPSLSGMGDYAYHLCKNLQAIGHQVLVYSQKIQGESPQDIDSVQVLRNAEDWDRRFWPDLKAQLQKYSPDIVHIQYMNLTFKNRIFIYFLPLWIKKHFPRIKTVITYHEFAAPLKRLTLLPLILFSDAHIVTNDHHFKNLQSIRKMLFNQKPLRRIPLAANILPDKSMKANRSVTRAQLGLHADEILLVRFGILHDVALPGLLTILEALALIAKDPTATKLLLIGKEEPAAKAMLLQKIKELELENRVLLKTDAPADLISAYLYASDIGLGLYPDGISEKRTAFLSLLAHELPVIATKRGDLPSELIPEKSFLPVLYDAPAQVWAEAIQKLIREPELRENIKEGGITVSGLHQWKRIAEARPFSISKSQG